MSSTFCADTDPSAVDHPRAVERPVLARTPRATEFIARRPELPIFSATRNHLPFAWQKRMHTQQAPPFLIPERRRLSICCPTVTSIFSFVPCLNCRLANAVQQPNLLQIRIRRSHSIKNNEHVVAGRVRALTREPFHL